MGTHGGRRGPGSERAQGEFSRQLFLGESLDRDDVAAAYADGVLTITIPVAEQAKPHRVEVTHVGSVAQAVEAATRAPPEYCPPRGSEPVPAQAALSPGGNFLLEVNRP